MVARDFSTQPKIEVTTVFWVVQIGNAWWAHIPHATWMFPKIGVPPNHPILIRFSTINHPFWGTLIFGNTHIYGLPSLRSPKRLRRRSLCECFGTNGWTLESTKFRSSRGFHPKMVVPFPNKSMGFSVFLKMIILGCEMGGTTI